MIIYAVIRKSTDEIVYIGQTTQSLPKKKEKHLSESRKGRGSVLGAAIRKHTIVEFNFIELESCKNQQELCKMEKHLIKKFKPRYNVQEGGKKNSTPFLTAKSRKKIKRDKYSK